MSRHVRGLRFRRSRVRLRLSPARYICLQARLEPRPRVALSYIVVSDQAPVFTKALKLKPQLRLRGKLLVHDFGGHLGNGKRAANLAFWADARTVRHHKAAPLTNHEPDYCCEYSPQSDSPRRCSLTPLETRGSCNTSTGVDPARVMGQGPIPTNQRPS